jgi:hypothetical protein
MTGMRRIFIVSRALKISEAHVSRTAWKRMGVVGAHIKGDFVLIRNGCWGKCENYAGFGGLRGAERFIRIQKAKRPLRRKAKDKNKK